MVDVIAVPGLVGIAFVRGAGTHEEMGVTIAGPVAQALFEDIEVFIAFNQPVQGVIAYRELRPGGYLILLGRKSIAYLVYFSSIKIFDPFGIGCLIEGTFHGFTGCIHLFGGVQIRDDDIAITVELVELQLG